MNATILSASFLELFIINIYFVFECIALLIVIIQYKKLKHTIYRHFLPYLIFIVVYEFLNLWDWLYINHSNLYLSNIEINISFIYYGYILKQLIRSSTYKKISTRLIIVALFCQVVNTAFIQGFWKFNSITVLFEYAIIIFVTCLYFYELINSISEGAFIAYPSFWLNTGLLFFCLFDFLYFSSFAYMAYKNNYHYYLLASAIVNTANVILYSCLSVCFLCFNLKNTQLKFEG